MVKGKLVTALCYYEDIQACECDAPYILNLSTRLSHQFLPLTYSTNCKGGFGEPEVSGQNGEQKITFPYQEMIPTSSSLWPVTLLTDYAAV